MDTITEHNFDRWLTEDRAISLHVANEAGIELVQNQSGEEVKIPVRGFDGKLLFSKYRRSPWSDSGTKYRYDRGAHAHLFGGENLAHIPFGSKVIITEGELDSLALRTLGFHAVSTTGGAGTFRIEWNDHLDPYDVVLLYDADKAGIEGVMRAASLAECSIAWIPVEFGKDATEVIGSGHIPELAKAIDSAINYHLPKRDDEYAVRIAQYKKILIQLHNERVMTLQDPAATPFHRDIAITWIQHELERAKKESEARITVRKSMEGTLVNRAKTYPIIELVKANREGFTKCVYHDEKSASMKVYKDNHAFSYCCSRRSDAIDIYQAIHSGISFNEAVRALTI